MLLYTNVTVSQVSKLGEMKFCSLLYIYWWFKFSQKVILWPLWQYIPTSMSNLSTSVKGLYVAFFASCYELFPSYYELFHNITNISLLIQIAFHKMVVGRVSVYLSHTICDFWLIHPTLPSIWCLNEVTPASVLSTFVQPTSPTSPFRKADIWPPWEVSATSGTFHCLNEVTSASVLSMFLQPN